MDKELEIVKKQFKNNVVRSKFKFNNEWWFVLSDKGTENLDWAPSFGVVVRDGKAIADIEFRKLQFTNSEFSKAYHNAELVDAINI